MNPGVYQGISNADYHADRTAVGQSGLKAVLKAPAFFFGQYLDPACPPESDRETPGRKFGNMVHCVLFEYPLFNQRYRVGPEVTSKAVKAWKDFAAELPAGCNGISRQEYDCALAVRASVLAIPEMAKALSVGAGEVSAWWTDPATGVKCKCRPDWVYPVSDDAVIIIDGKTFASAEPGEFTRQAVKMDYFMQAAWYSDGYALASGKKVLAFIFLVVSDDYPYLASAMMPDDESIEAGRRKYRRGLDSYAACLKSGVWPGYSHDIKLISMPAWAKEQTA